MEESTSNSRAPIFNHQYRPNIGSVAPLKADLYKLLVSRTSTESSTMDQTKIPSSATEDLHLVAQIGVSLLDYSNELEKQLEERLSENQKQTEKIHELEESIASMQTQFMRSAESQKVLQNRLWGLDTLNQEHLARIDEFEKALNKAHNENQILNDDNLFIQKRLDEVTLSEQKLMTKQALEEADHEAELVRLQKQLHEVKKDNSELKKLLDGYIAKSIESKDFEKESPQESSNNVSESFSYLRDENVRLVELLSEFERENDALRKEIEKSNLEKKELSDLLSEKQEVISEFHGRSISRSSSFSHSHVLSNSRVPLNLELIEEEKVTVIDAQIQTSDSSMEDKEIQVICESNNVCIQTEIVESLSSIDTVVLQSGSMEDVIEKSQVPTGMQTPVGRVPPSSVNEPASFNSTDENNELASKLKSYFLKLSQSVKQSSIAISPRPIRKTADGEFRLLSSSKLDFSDIIERKKAEEQEAETKDQLNENPSINDEDNKTKELHSGDLDSMLSLKRKSLSQGFSKRSFSIHNVFSSKLKPKRPISNADRPLFGSSSAHSLSRSPSMQQANMVSSLTNMMAGTWMYKYPRSMNSKLLLNETIEVKKLHKRYFWINPLTMTIMWGDNDPAFSKKNKSAVARIFGVTSEYKRLPKLKSSDSLGFLQQKDSDSIADITQLLEPDAIRVNNRDSDFREILMIIIKTGNRSRSKDELCIIPMTLFDQENWLKGLQRLLDSKDDTLAKWAVVDTSIPA